ncbi:hypothetical protein BDB00DRAFT_770802 [Zychaea mexicana]|uniref:uncharacterized protein n=1 Tax=Zychaea mexicana TaxID=64656 RepID=UPI0022FF2AB7|nr:uncharacterized protein BDB00DRAFT_770802 [Zychaea mexicana]KAI9489339.1 hypothetical protein BDB00DRAFT_770802 [Zychaea mexicana]
MNVTRGQAACMFFQQEYNLENEKKLLDKIDGFGDVDICFMKDPTEPFLLYIPNIHSNPPTKPPQPLEEQPSNDEQASVTEKIRRLSSTPQVVHFLNEVFLSYNPYNDVVYEYREYSNDMILEVARRHTAMFDNKSAVGFGKWCSTQGIHFYKVNQKRKRSDDVRFQLLYVLKESFMGKLCFILAENGSKLILYIRNNR